MATRRKEVFLATKMQDTITVAEAGALQAKAVMLMDRAGYK